MSTPEQVWYFCPECGAVRPSRLFGHEFPNPTCPINGADSPMVPISEAVAKALIEYAERLATAQDDPGVFIRLGSITLGRNDGRWFIKRWRNGKWSHTSYGNTFWEALRG